MAGQACPHLGTLDANHRRASAVEFPSFENYCLATPTPELVMLGDQATFCLSGACAGCPRFVPPNAQQPRPAAYVPFYNTAEEAWQQAGAPAGMGVVGLENLDEDFGGQPPESRKRWARAGAALVFLAVLACGSLSAAWSGWQWVTRDLRSEVAGRVDTVAAAATAPVPAIYVVMTATAEPGSGQDAAAGTGQAGNQGAPVNGQGNGATTGPGGTGGNGIIPVLPAAVTPTPIGIDPSAISAPEASQPGAEAPPLVDVDLQVPTRRPTPEFDLPTSTPAPLDESTPTPSPSPTPAPLGTPIISFVPDKPALPGDECTLVRWNVQNVREVYYENLPVNGKGSKRECISDEAQVFELRLILSDGATQIVTTTLGYLPPTPTITPTPSFTPEPVFTPTWTPEPPKPTQPPNMVYATILTVQGATDITCAPGQSCDVSLLVTNSGTGPDNQTLALTANNSPFPLQLCRADGVCGADNVLIGAMGPGNTASVTARISVPGDAAPQTVGSYTFIARSEGAGGMVTSAPVTINVSTP